MVTSPPVAELPPMPQPGLPEAYYIRRAHEASRAGNHHLHEALKVAQYIAVGTDPKLKWPAKVHAFRHAIKHHCNAPSIPDDRVWEFYSNLRMLVRDACGQEALRLASHEDDVFAKQVTLGRPPGQVEEDAQRFFDELMGRGSHCPEHFHPEDWEQLRVFREQWV